MGEGKVEGRSVLVDVLAVLDDHGPNISWFEGVSANTTRVEWTNFYNQRSI
jgi:hypothetical protein